MSLSSNSLIHFTSTPEALIGILNNEFKIKYCLEEIQVIGDAIRIAVPMVSFCDIPLSEVKEHIRKYGSYGIGLKKEWGVEKRINPVFYVEQNSNIGEHLHKITRSLLKGKSVSVYSPEEVSLADVYRYLKNYEGGLTKGIVSKDHYRFADEKEWRYVPGKDEALMLLNASEYEADKEKFNNRISNLRLSFGPKDINYIIIKEESEIKLFIKVLREAKGHKYSLEDIEKLMTRIITCQQIETDF